MKLLVFLFFILNYFHLNAIASENEAIWNYSNGNYQGHKYSSLKKIDVSNVNSLKKAWSHSNGFIPSIKNNSQVIPVFTGKSIITSSVDGYVISLNPANGKENWRTKLSKPVAKRGMVFLRENQIVLVTTRKGVVAIDERSGKINKNFGNNGVYGKGLSLVAPIVNNKNIHIAFRTKIESFVLKTGKKRWSFDLNGARVWSGFSFDKKTNTIAVVTSNLINLWGKTDIKPDYSNSLILLNSKTGKEKCKFKDVKHDHWDLDMVGSPIFTNIRLDNVTKRVVYAFSKTGNVFAIDLKKCDFVFNNKKNFKIIETETPNNGQTYSKKQIKILKPEPLLDQKYDLNEYLNTLTSKKKMDYIKFKAKKSKYGKEFIPLSLNYDVIFFGLHGGPSWSGGTLDNINNQIIIATNHYPWILRSFYLDKLLNKILVKNSNLKEIFNKSDHLSPWQKKNNGDDEKKIKKIYSNALSLIDLQGSKVYKTKCQSCHGVVKEGVYFSESEGDRYIPNLMGVSFTNKIKSLNSLKNFENAHKYAKKTNINEKDLKLVKNYLTKKDKLLKKLGLLYEYGAWQLFLDDEKLPASIPPWGKLNAININTGKINWSKPIGFRKTKTGKIIKGDFSFGGVLSTAGNLLFATGTPDKYLRAYESNSGKKLWEYKLPAAGSSSPITYLYNDEQYILVNSGGGKFFGFEEKLGDQIIAFKLN